VTIPDDISGSAAKRNRFEVTLDYYLRGVALILMVLGLRAWAVIVGMIDGPGGAFEQMPQAWQIATMHMSVVDLVAAVGLWMHASWGRVVWIYAVLSEITIHTVFVGTFGSNLVIVAIHTLALIGFIALLLLASRAEAPD
jgi:hypothetical protein